MPPAGKLQVIIKTAIRLMAAKGRSGLTAAPLATEAASRCSVIRLMAIPLLADAIIGRDLCDDIELPDYGEIGKVEA